MNIVLIKQYTESPNREADIAALQTAFKNSKIISIICPSGIEVELLPNVRNTQQIVVITVPNDKKSIRKSADKVKADLQENGIQAIILPYNTSVEVLPI